MKKSELRQIIREEILREFHEKDEILVGITYNELISTVQANESEISERTIKKTFDELLKTNISDAKYELRQNMKAILKAAK